MAKIHEVTSKTLPADIVLEGGGVKGIGLVGALNVLSGHGYSYRRIAGTSAGAIVGALLASGMSMVRMTQVMNTVVYKKFQDDNFLDRFGLLGKTGSLLLEKGIYKGKYAHDWLEQQLSSQGVHTFADLRLTEDWGSDFPKEQAYKLVVVVSDVSSGQLVRLPWDYPKFGLDPDKQKVADAVRASMSIPFFFKPVKLHGHYLVDGGALSNFPIAIFDRPTGVEPKWPTFGIKLSAKPATNFSVQHKVHGTIGLAEALIGTMSNAHDQMHLDDPSVIARTIFVDTGNIKGTDFNLQPKQKDFLFKNGEAGAQKFLSTWDFQRYVKMYRTQSTTNI